MTEVLGVSGYHVYRYHGKEVAVRVFEDGKEYEGDIPEDLPEDAGGYSITAASASFLWQLEITNNEDMCIPADLSPLAAKAQKALSGIMLLKPGQKALIIYDRPKKKLGEAFVAGARAIGADVAGYMLPENRFENGVAEDIISRIRTGTYSVCVNIFEGRPEEVKYRIAILNAEEKHVPRTAHSPGLTAEMLSLPVDYPAMKTSREKLLKTLKGAEKVRVTTALGTDIEIRFGKARKWFDDITFDSSPAINIPNGEVYCGPLEDGANGKMVADGSMGDFGLAPSPLVIEVKNGKIPEKDGELVGVRWLNPKFEDQTNLLSRIRQELKSDAMASVIGEFGIGLAPYPLVGELLQDEKAARTIHIAFGNNETEGGINKSEKHIDFLVKDPTVEVFYPEEAKLPSKKILLEGTLVL